MSGPALERVFRAASGRIISALAARFRNLTLAEDAFSEACVRALVDWPKTGVPEDPSAWLYRAASRIVLDYLRQHRVRETYRRTVPVDEDLGDDTRADDHLIVPDERLRLIFICCHPAIAEDARAALTLKLVCGLTTTEIARAFLVPDATLAQRLLRARRKISEAGVPFELPPPEHWSERLEAVLTTLEIAYAKAHDDASGTGPHAAYAQEVLHLTRLLTELLPQESGTHALAALVRYSEARRSARVDFEGVMVPLSAQDPALWNHQLIEEADVLLSSAERLQPTDARTLQARLQAIWCFRRRLQDAPPWGEILRAYDHLLLVRDDVVVRINRAVALAGLAGPASALQELDQLTDESLTTFPPYHAVRADLLARVGRVSEARLAYESFLSFEPGPAEARWIRRRLAALAQSSQ